MISLHQFVASTKNSYTQGVGCTVDESLLGFRKKTQLQAVYSKQAKKVWQQGVRVCRQQTFYSVSFKIYAGSGTHIPGLLTPTQAMMDLTQLIAETNRYINIDIYFTFISLAENLKAHNLTLVGKMKKNKRCIPPNFLTKTDPGTVQCAFDHADDFTLLFIASKRKKGVVFFCLQCTHCHAMVRMRKTRKMFYNHENGNVDSHGKMCALDTAAKKKIVSQ